MKRLDAWWSALEVALVVLVTATLTLALVLWVALKGLSSRTTDTFFAGVVFRALVGFGGLGAVTWRVTRRQSATAAACGLGLAASWLWRDVGVEWATNVLGWLQDGSTLTLFGGLRGFGTRLTLWLALLGASLATASGRHVSIDVANRALGDSWRGPLQRVGNVIAAVVCLASAWAFFDFTAVDAFGATGSVGGKVETVMTGLSRHAFLVRRQLALDAAMMPSVLNGAEWSHQLQNSEWNAWVDAGNWEAYYPPTVVAALHEPGAGTRAPLITTPGEATRGLLVKTMNLIVPFGLLMIALRFLLALVVVPA